MATTIYFWTYTCTRTGKRRRTRYRLTEDVARERLLDPVRIEHDALTIESAPITLGGHWVSGLVPPDESAGVAASAGQAEGCECTSDPSSSPCPGASLGAHGSE